MGEHTAIMKHRTHIAPLWCWSTAIAAALLALFARPTLALTPRGLEAMERVLLLTADPEHGKALFGEHCSSCHGSNANGNPETVTPSLAGQLPIYIVKQLIDIAEGVRQAPEMHRVVAKKPVNNLQALRDLSTFLGSLPAPSDPETGDGKSLTAGQRYYQGLCAFCHGQRGEGNAEHATPALARQQYSYLVMQMRDIATFHRDTVDVEIVDSLEKLSYDHMMAIADHLSRIPVASPLDAGRP